jgi:hypothetical protein
MLTVDDGNGYVLDDPEVAPPAGMVLTLVPPRPAEDDGPELYDQEQEAPEVDERDDVEHLGWDTFVTEVHDGDYTDAERIVLLALAVMSEGKPGVAVDVDELAGRARRRPATVAPMVPRLVAAGWLEMFPDLSPAGRPVKRYRTRKMIG